MVHAISPNQTGRNRISVDTLISTLGYGSCKHEQATKSGQRKTDSFHFYTGLKFISMILTTGGLGHPRS